MSAAGPAPDQVDLSGRVDTSDVVLPDERPVPGYVRVDLLPDSIKQHQRVRRAKRIAATLVVLALLLVAAAWYVTRMQISGAESQLATEQSTGAQLQAEIATYAQVPAVFAANEAAQAALSTAMGAEVRWSFLLNQLTFATPSGVTLNTIQGAISETGLTPSSPGNALPPANSVGTMTFGGEATSYGSVAAWLVSLTALKDYTYPFLTSSAREEGGRALTWESTAGLGENALSGRYGAPAAPPAGSDSGGTTPAPAPSAPATPDDGAQGSAQ